MSADPDKPLETLRGNCLIPAKIRARKEIQQRIFRYLCSLRKMQGVDPAVYPVVERDCNYDSLQNQTNAEFSALETESLLGPRLNDIAWKLDTLIDRPPVAGANASPKKAGTPGTRPATRPAPVTGWRSYARTITRYGAMMAKPTIVAAAVAAAVGFVMVSVVGYTRLRADYADLKDAAAQDRLALQKSIAALSNQLRGQAQQSGSDTINLQQVRNGSKGSYLRVLPDGSKIPVQITVAPPTEPDASPPEASPTTPTQPPPPPNPKSGKTP